MVHTVTGAPFALPSLLIVPALVCPNLLLDVLNRVPMSRVMAGSDLMESAEVELGKVIGLPVDEATRRAILWDTPRCVFDGV